MAVKTKFDKRLNKLPLNIVSKIASIDELKGKWSAGINLNPYLLGRLQKSVLITSTGASTRIEGAKLSDEEVEKLMEGLIMQKLADRDKQEVKSYYELLKNVFDAWQDIPFSEGSIKHLHKELLKYVQKDSLHRGQYKRHDNQVRMVDYQGQDLGILFDTTPAYLTSKQMQELTEWTKKALEQKSYHPLLITASFIVEFLNIHPFEDGNGRLSRVLTNLLLLKTGYLYMPFVSHEKLIEEQKAGYYLALRKSQKTFKSNENINDWTGFFLEILYIQAKEATALIGSENIETILSPLQLTIWQYLQTVSEAKPQEIADKTGIARSTVNKTIIKLLSLGKVERMGLARSIRYRKI